jgi:hypothetical protein
VDVATPEQRPKHVEESRPAVALLQSLGPVQDQPIDLSVRTGPQNKTVKHRSRKGSKGHSSSEDSAEEDGEVSSGSDGGEESCDDEGAGAENEHLEERGGESGNRKPISTPLDLTTRT